MYYYLPLFFTFLNLLVTLVLFYYAFFLFKKEQNLNEKSKDSLLEYEKTLEAATKKAQNILEHTEIVSKDLKNSYAGVFEKISLDIKNNTEDFLKGVLIDQELILKEFTKNVNDKYSLLFQKTLNTADSNYLQKQKALDTEIREKVESASKSIEEYKKAKISEIDKIIESSVEALVKKSLPKYIKIEDQQTMVLDVINKANEDGFFNKI